MLQTLFIAWGQASGDLLGWNSHTVAWEIQFKSYPRDWTPYLNLGVASANIGQHETAADVTLESLKAHPDNSSAYENLGGFYLALNRFPEVRDIANLGRMVRQQRNFAVASQICPHAKPIV